MARKNIQETRVFFTILSTQKPPFLALIGKILIKFLRFWHFDGKGGGYNPV